MVSIPIRQSLTLRLRGTNLKLTYCAGIHIIQLVFTAGTQSCCSLGHSVSGLPCECKDRNSGSQEEKNREEKQDDNRTDPSGPQCSMKPRHVSLQVRCAQVLRTHPHTSAVVRIVISNAIQGGWKINWSMATAVSTPAYAERHTHAGVKRQNTTPLAVGSSSTYSSSWCQVPRVQ